MGRSRRLRGFRRWVVGGLSVLGLGIALLQDVLAPPLPAGAGTREEGLSEEEARSLALSSSQQECEAALPARGSRERAVASWNLRWFPLGVSPERAEDGEGSDVRWMACVMAHLQAPVIAVQEVLNDDRAKAAQDTLLARLNELTGGRHRIVLDECAVDSQHVGLIYDEKRVQLLETHVEASLNPGGQACRNRLRPGVSGRFRFLERDGRGNDLTVITVHLDSGVTSRDHANRVRSLQALHELLTGAEEDTLVIGDFNTMGEKGKSAEEDAQQERSQLEERSGLVRLAPQVSCTHYQRGHASELDHALATASLARKAQLTSLGPCAARRCKALGKSLSGFAEQVSDHCPLRVALAQ